MVQGPLTDLLKTSLPSWVTEINAWATLEPIAAAFDDQLVLAASALRKRFPLFDADGADALPLIGSDRQIIQGLSETAANYAGRLKTWLTQHKSRGGPYKLIEQVAEFYRYAMAGETLIINLHTRNEDWYQWDSATGLTTQGTAPWPYDSETNRWARWRLHVHLNAAPITPTAEEALRVPIKWNALHCFGLVIIQKNGAVLWGEPGVVWGDPLVLWGPAADTVTHETNPLLPPAYDSGYDTGYN